MRFAVIGTLLGMGLLCSCTPSAPPESAASILPLRTVRLYETGVGYFERTGNVSAASGTSLPVPAAHLDDALKTLVVHGQGGESTIDGLEFDSSVSEGMARALAGLPKEAQSTITYMRMLGSLEGEDVEVRTKDATYQGRVIDVIPPPPDAAVPSSSSDDDDESDSRHHKKSAQDKPEPKPELMLLLLTADNEIRQFPSTEIVAVRPTSAVAASRLGLALNSLSSRAAQRRRMVRVIAASNRPVTLGYIAETPLWRTTYRVVLDTEGKQGMLQGWALMHNDTDEDWKQVRVQLVNGRPDSFLFPLAAPRYGRRGLVTPEEPLSTIPQLLDKTPDAIWGDYAELEGSVGYGSGAGHGRLGGSHRTRAPSVRMGATTVGSGSGVSDMLNIGNLATSEQATGVESAALFIYTLPRPLDLRAHGSALVPFVQAAVQAKPITWIDDDDEPRLGVYFVNSTQQTLPAGPVAFFSDGGFAGETALDRLKPREKRYMQFSMDLDVDASRETTESSEETRKLTFKNDRLMEHYLRKDTVKYVIENRSGQERRVHWTLPVVFNAKVEGPDEVTFDEKVGKPIAVFVIPPRKKIERVVTMEQGLSRWRDMGSLSADWLAQFEKAESIPVEQRKIVADAIARRKKVEETQAARTKNQQATEEVEKDLERLREHLKALGGEKGTGIAANPFVKRILDAEDRLVALRTKAQELGKESEERIEALRRELMRLAP